MQNNAYQPANTSNQREALREKKFDPSTGKWSTLTTYSDSDTVTPSDSGSDSDKTTSKGKADKEYKEIEINTLTGELEVVPNEITIKIKSGDTVALKGLGKYLSGQYFVNSVTRKIDNQAGYSHSFTVLKTGFGSSSLKGNVRSEVESAETTDRPAELNKESETKTHVMSSGDTLSSLAFKYYGDPSQYNKIAEANGISEDEYGKIPVGKELKIP